MSQGSKRMGNRAAVIRALWQTRAALAMVEMVSKRMAASQPANDNGTADQKVAS